MNIDAEIAFCKRLKREDFKLMAQASVYLAEDPDVVTEIRRGMLFVSAEGQEAGKVAGIVIRRDSQQVLCLLISHLPQAAGYQALPLSWIARVKGERVFLSAGLTQVLALPGWHAA